MSRLAALFATGERPIMSLFLTAGYPTLDSTVGLALRLQQAGADLLEIGMPFSDPLADGPTIQQASDVAIANGVTIPHILDMVRGIRAQSGIPLVLMGYINPILNYGFDRFFREAAEAGADGIILPDVPPEEGHAVRQACAAAGLDFILLVAPNTSDERMRRIDSESTGFVYCVSVTGVTGARDGATLRQSVDAFKDRVRANITKNPVLVGFGIRSHEDAIQVSRGLDGYIVGSALIESIRGAHPSPDWQDRVAAFVRSVKS